MEHQELIPHLFRTEYRKIVSVLCKRFGMDRMEIAEDMASDTFLTAAQTWPLSGFPANPAAWLYNVAKNKASNYLQREAAFRSKVLPEIKNAGSLPSDPSGTDAVDAILDLSAKNITDSQLQMMFALCHPSISPEAQIGLSLRILCGFGIDEIAAAFLVSKETINKRLSRARERLRQERIRIELPPLPDIEDRLAAVLRTIYLLFSEGYYSICRDDVLRTELCLEAMRLCYMLVENDYTDRPEVSALMALMCLQSSRFVARMDKDGTMIPYEEQDSSRWDMELIGKGTYFMNRSASGSKVSKYHLEAAIAWWSTKQNDLPEKWEKILYLYDQLLKVEYSPVAALNRVYAVAKVHGKKEAIDQAEKLDLTTDQFYFALLGELYTGLDNEKAISHFRSALSLAKTQTDKRTMQKKIGNLAGHRP